MTSWQASNAFCQLSWAQFDDSLQNNFTIRQNDGKQRKTKLIEFRVANFNFKCVRLCVCFLDRLSFGVGFVNVKFACQRKCDFESRQHEKRPKKTNRKLGMNQRRLTASNLPLPPHPFPPTHTHTHISHGSFFSSSAYRFNLFCICLGRT